MSNEVLQDLLIEIGTEELPPKSLSNLMRAFAGNIERALTDVQLTFDSVSCYSTPRRLAVLVKQLIAAQPDQVVEKRGPSVKAAYEADGNPSKAALGFMRACGIDDIDLLDKLSTDKGSWLIYRQQKPGAGLPELISGVINDSLSDLPIDRKMRWGANRTEFIRPVHWLVVLYGQQILPAVVLGISAGNISYGHRFMCPAAITLIDPGEYIDSLYRAKVIVDFDKRKRLIAEQLESIAIAEEAEVIIDKDLIDEVTSLVEWPVALIGNFSANFLSVPEEALISAMKSHQRYFHLVDREGHLLPKFITIANIESSNPATVIAGNERVITPRLADAAFFFNRDKKSSLEAKLVRLKNVVFQSKLGSYHDKANRVSELAGFVADSIGADVVSAKRAGLLCKADLISDMVNEFPELQGLMGGYYARFDGETEAVCEAIADHYKPIASGSDLPVSLVSQCVAIADKADTICGLFAIGQPPSGSRDPFALRRQTLGIIRICISKTLTINLRQLFDQSLKYHGFKYDSEEIHSYLLERLGTWYQELGISQDTFNAVRASNVAIDNLTEADSRIQSLQVFRGHEKAVNLVAANKRLANILKTVAVDKLPDVDPELFEIEAEKALLGSLQSAASRLTDAPTNEEKFLILADLQPVIDGYFDDVMVMSDDETQKNNRLATLLQVRRLFLTVADLSVLQ